MASGVRLVRHVPGSASPALDSNPEVEIDVGFISYDISANDIDAGSDSGHGTAVRS